MREIVLDTETTGFNPEDGHRVIEIGAVELFNHIPTGKTLQLYINPERDVPAEAIAVHGITNAFLKDKPIFSQVYSEFLDFIGDDSKLVIHNAEFDMKFLNWELKLVGHPSLDWARAIDTVVIARKKFPGSPANLDALCRRFNIDNSNRTFHGALLDSSLLAEVYLELLGGRQHGLGFGNIDLQQISSLVSDSQSLKREPRPPRSFLVSEEEKNAHLLMIEKLKNPVWKKLLS